MWVSSSWWGWTYSLFINIIIIFWYLRRIEEIEETFTIFSFSDGFGVLWSLPWLLLQKLLCQALPREPFNLRPSRVTKKSIMKRKKRAYLILLMLRDHNYPIAFSRIGSSSSIMWYVFVRTEFLKYGFGSKKKSSLKPLGSSILHHLISLRYFRAPSSRSEI